MRKVTVFLLAALSIASSGGCRRATGRAKVSVSVFPIYDLVRRVAGPDADVTLVAKEHDGPPLDAKLVVEVGLGLDPWIDPRVPPKTRVLKVGDRVPTIPAIKDAATEGDAAINPYVWMDPQRARLIVVAIAEDLARTDASHAKAFRERAAALDAALDALDREIDARTSTWASHTLGAPDASMAYFAERYRLVVAPGAPGAASPTAAVDPIGGAAPLDSYEAVIRFDTAALESALR